MTDAEVVARFILPARAFVVDGAAGRQAGGAAFARRPGTAANPAPVFYSELLRQVQAAPMNAGQASAWRQYIGGLIGKGVKADEIAWSGVNDWLDLQPGKVTRQQVAAYLDANGVKVEEELIGSDSKAEITVGFDPDQGLFVVYADGKEIETASAREDAEQEAERIRNDPEEMAALNGTEFGGLVLPGAKSYRELLLKLPAMSQFDSQHWPGRSNVLAHVRFNDRRDDQRRRVLVIEELQSDWSAALRKQDTAGRQSDTSTPAAPFAGKVDAWVSLALKRLIRYATDNGFDRVAFITGQQAHERFPYQDGEGTTLAGLSAFYGELDGGVLGDNGQTTGKRPILHNIARDVLKKLGGDGLVTMQLNGKGRAKLKQVGFDITPTMREKAAAGLPMFSRRPAADQGTGRSQVDDFKAWLGATDGGATGRPVNFTDSGRATRPSTEPAAPFLQQRDALPDMIDVDGQQRPTVDANGRPMALDEEGARSFWRWFRDSQAVDADGKPLMLFYPASDEIKRVQVASKGLFGSGVYLFTDARRAGARTLNSGQTAPNIVPVYAAMQNPYVYEGASRAVPAGFEERGRSDIDSAAGGLIAAILPRSSVEQMLAHMASGKVQLGDVIRKRLVEMGHDGLIVRFADPADGQPQYIVFKPEHAKSKIGNDGSFSPDTKDIRFQRRVDLEQQPARDFALRPFGRVGRGIEVMQDRYNRWKHAIDDVRRQGGSITDANDFYRAEERYWGQVGAGIEDFKDELTTFVKAVNADGLTVDDVALYAYAQHAEERNELIAGRRPHMPDGGSGMTTDEADEILQAARDAGVEAELQRHAATLRQWIQGTREVLLQGGLIDQDQHDTWAGMFQQYVPLRGVEDTDAAGEGRVAPGRQRRRGGIRGDEAEHAEGRQARALQIVEQIAADRSRALVRVGRNEVLRSFARFVLDNPSPSLWEVNAVERRRTVTVDEDGYRTVQEAEEVIKDGRTITLKDDGQEVHILVKDAKLLEQLQRLGLDEHPAWAVGALLSANRWLSRVYTSLSPVFTAINALRDTQAAAIGMIDEIGFMGLPKLFAALPRAWVDSFKAEAGRPSADYAVFKALGGRTSFHNLVTVDQQAKELEAVVADAERMAIDPRKFLPKAMALIEALNGGIENATRLAAFNVARKSGMTAVQAASVAKNITVNFNRRGTQQLANAWVLFFNPAVQGTTRLAQAMTNPKVQAAIGTAMLGVAALALRNIGMGDDDDGVAWWDKIPDEVKERNLVIVLPPGSTAGEAVPKSKTGRYVKVPMPYGYNFFAVIANQMVDVWRHSQDAKRGRDLVRGGVTGPSALSRRAGCRPPTWGARCRPTMPRAPARARCCCWCPTRWIRWPASASTKTASAGRCAPTAASAAACPTAPGTSAASTARCSSAVRRP